MSLLAAAKVSTSFVLARKIENTNIVTSRQIRPPIYSLKQSKLRKRRVVRFAILYFSMLVLFLVLLIVPLIARKYKSSLGLDDDPLASVAGGGLLQPLDTKNNNTIQGYTGSNLPVGMQPISSGFGAPTPSGSSTG